MADVKNSYVGEAAATITLASLADAAARESTAVDNSANKYLDALVTVQIKLQAGTPASDKAVYVYVYGGPSTSPTWPDAVTGSDAAITLNSPVNLDLLMAIQAPTSAGTFKRGQKSVAALFGGTLPEKWGVVILNKTGIALDATGTNHKVLYQPVYATSL